MLYLFMKRPRAIQTQTYVVMTLKRLAGPTGALYPLKPYQAKQLTRLNVEFDLASQPNPEPLRKYLKGFTKRKGEG